jgi:hypothetical protein
LALGYEFADSPAIRQSAASVSANRNRDPEIPMAIRRTPARFSIADLPHADRQQDSLLRSGHSRAIEALPVFV